MLYLAVMKDYVHKLDGNLVCPGKYLLFGLWPTLISLTVFSLGKLLAILTHVCMREQTEK